MSGEQAKNTKMNNGEVSSTLSFLQFCLDEWNRAKTQTHKHEKTEVNV